VVNIFIILVCFFLAGFFHQGLYFLIPFLTLYYVSTKKESKLFINPISKIYLNIIIIVLMFCLIQSVLSLEIEIFSLKGLLRFVAYFLFAVLISYVRISDIKAFFKLIVFYFLITIPVGVYQFLEWGRYRNTWDHSNHLAYVLSMCIYFFIFHKPFKDRKINNICVFGLIISLLLTKSTGGLLVLIALLGYNALRSSKISFFQKVVFALLAFSSISLSVRFSKKIAFQLESIDFLTSDFIKERVEIYTIDGVNRAGGYGSFVWRVIYWSKLLATFFSESFVTVFFGVGVDHLTKGFMPYEFMDKDPHNDFIKVLLEYGVLGFILFLGFFRLIYKTLSKNFNIIILMVIPMFFGNAIVNYPFNLTLIIILMHEFKKNYSNAH